MIELSVIFWSAAHCLGENARAASLAYRAGSSGMRECPIGGPDGAPVTLCSFPLLDPLLEGLPRTQELLRHGLTELLGHSLPRLAQGRIKLFVLVDEDQALTRPDGRSNAEELAQAARTQVQDAVGARVLVEVEATGPTALAAVTLRVTAELERAEYEVALLVGVHSDYDVARIGALTAAGRVHSSDNLDALLLGECVSGVVLMDAARARSFGITPVARLGAAELTREKARIDNDESAFEAAGLTVAARRATEPFSRGPTIGWVSSDANFEMFRSYELTAVLVRLQSRLGLPQHLDAPCQRLGSLGAATGLWQVAYACELFLRGGAIAPLLLCLAGSDDGTRAAFVVSAA